MSNYNNLFLYKLAYLASQEGTHSKNNKFWENKIELLGTDFFEGKGPEAIRSKWKKIMKEVYPSPEQRQHLQDTHHL